MKTSCVRSRFNLRSILFLLAAVCLALSSSPSSAATALDIYGGVTAGNVPSEATGLMHVKKVNGRWVFYTALGNPTWELAFDNARLGNDLGVDINGNGNGYYAAKKYAIGQGPVDGFTDSTTRWAYYVRAMARSWGFLSAGSFNYSPVVTNATNWIDPVMGTMPSNKMTFVITHENSASAMTAGAKNIYASVFSTVGSSPYFADPYDPKFASSVATLAGTLAAHPRDPWVRYIFTGETDELRGLSGTHPHLGFVVAASAPSISTDSNAYGGKQTYTDTKNYAKYALHDYLTSVYPNIAALNKAWGTSYTTFDSAGGWGTGTGFLDENGSHLCSTWYKPGPSYPCSNVAMRTDLDAFATQLVRQYYKTMHNGYRAVTQYLLESADYADSIWPYAIAGMLDAQGAPLVDVVSLVTTPASQTDVTIYNTVGIPIIYQMQEMADNDSAVSMNGTIAAVSSMGTETECGTPNQGVQVTSNDANFWWWHGATNGAGFIIPYSNNSLLKFSSVPYFKTDGITKYLYYFRRFIDAHNMVVCPYNFGAANRTMLLSFLKPGDTFKRTDWTEYQNTPDTQTARAAIYASFVSNAWNRVSSSGDHIALGLNFWAWWDNNWINSKYREVENFGLVTPLGNAYDGVQAVLGKTIDQYGFPAGGEAATYGNVLGSVTTSNTSIWSNLAAY